MKNLLILLLAFVAFQTRAVPAHTYLKLVEINACWTEQPDIDKLAYPEYDNRTEREWIRTHLSLVEQTLRARSTAHLSEQQKANRLKALSHLKQYWHEGSFPINDQYNYRTPIFIDNYDNFCAVGYLVKATGYEHVSRKIAAQTNLAYVREMNYPELFAWASDYGFTVDELAWIQPSYVQTPHGKCNPVGGGADGEIFEMYVGNNGARLYVGGAFNIVDSSITSPGIAYITDSANVYRWHGLGAGLNGEVHAIIEFDNKLFVGGAFDKSGNTTVNNIAYWDGTQWNAAGCIDGVVKDFAVMENELYACGDFDMCNGVKDVNLAKWTGSGWQAIQGLSGRINVMHVIGNELVLGGYFNYAGQSTNIIKWYKQFGFYKYSTTVAEEVMDIELFKNTYYLATRNINGNSTIYNRSGTALWVPISTPNVGANRWSFNTLCGEQDTLWLGGDFFQYPPMPFFGSSYHVSYSSNLSITFGQMVSWGDNSFYLDSIVNKFIVFKGALIGTGAFTAKRNGWPKLNHIFYRAGNPPVPPPPPPYMPPYSEAIAENGGFIDVGNTILPNSIEAVEARNAYCRLYPNPVQNVLFIESNFPVKEITLSDISGRVVLQQVLTGSTNMQISLHQLSPGIYMAQLSGDGIKLTQRLTVQ